MLVIVKASKRFHIYLFGLQFFVTDCYALAYAVNTANLNPRISRWTLKLQSYNFTISNRLGIKMSHVDTLSKIVYLISTLLLEKELEFRQLNDLLLKKLLKKNPIKFELINRLIFKKLTNPDYMHQKVWLKM